jgi:hypothetical protein
LLTYRVAVKESLEAVETIFLRQGGTDWINTPVKVVGKTSISERTSNNMPAISSLSLWLLLKQVDKMQHRSKMYNNSLTTSEIG